MKSATFPSLRVAPELREAAEGVLQQGESLSSFVESAIRRQVSQRRSQEEFIARGLVSRDKAAASGRYVSSNAVLDKLEAKLAEAKRQA